MHLGRTTLSTFLIQQLQGAQDQGKLAALPDFGVAHMARWLQATRRNIFHFWHDDFFQQWLARQDLSTFDLRLLARAMREAGDEHDSVAMACITSTALGLRCSFLPDSSMTLLMMLSVVMKSGQSELSPSSPR